MACKKRPALWNGCIDVVWNIADILNGAMCIPNVIAVFLLSKEIAKETEYYLDEGHLEEDDPDIE